MPHECTTCSRVFADGSKEMLSGCPDCGGNKFQFRPGGSGGDGGSSAADAAADGATAGRAAAEPPEPPEPETPAGTVAETVAGATERVRNLVGSDDEPNDDDRPIGDDPSGDGSSGGDPPWPSVGRESDANVDPRDSDAGSATARSETEIPTTDEDTAQASARSSVVERDELPDPPERGLETELASGAADAAASQVDSQSPPDADPAADGAAPSAEPEPPAAERDAADTAPSTGADDAEEPGSAPFTGSGDRESPDLSELRDELNSQFESIKIVERGQYELNLMELYDREEYIVSLMEDGRYAIEVPETWRDD